MRYDCTISPYLETRGASGDSGRSNLAKGRKQTNRIVDLRGNGLFFSGDIKHVERLDGLTGERGSSENGDRERTTARMVSVMTSSAFDRGILDEMCRRRTFNLQGAKLRALTPDGVSNVEIELVGKDREKGLSL